MMNQALGVLEVTGFTPAMVALDAMEKSASITLLQAEINDFLGVVVKIGGEPAAVQAAIDAGQAAAESFGVKVITAVIPRVDQDAWEHGILSRQEISPLLQQAVVLGPFPNQSSTDGPVAAKPAAGRSKKARSVSEVSEGKPMSDYQAQALGFIETQGFTAVFEAVDSACKAANVEVVAKEKLGGGYITVVIRGDVAAVKTAIDVAGAKAGTLGKLIAAHVIPRPSNNVLALLPKV
ncbi:MAG: BMC domain-containing protein [Pirellulaceae bacterium]